MDETAPASPCRAWYSKKRYLIPLLVAVILLAGWIGLSLRLLNDEWLKDRLVQYVRESFDAEMQVETLSFSPWTGEAHLTGIVLQRDKRPSQLRVAVDSAELQLRILPLLRRKLDVTRVVLTAPHMVFEKQLPPEPELEPTLDRLRKLLAVTLLAERVARLFTEPVDALGEGLGATSEWEINVARLTIHDGQFDYRAVRDGAKPFESSAKHVDYSINDLDLSPGRVRYTSPLQFLQTADLRCDLDLGGIPGTLDLALASKPNSVSLTGIDLGYLDRHLKQKDALVIRAGTLDVAHFAGEQKWQFEVKLKGLKLQRNPEAHFDGPLLRPVDWLISQVDKGGEDLTLGFELDRGEIRTSEDLRTLLIEVWNAMWSQILARFKADGLSQLREQLEADDFKLLEKQGVEMIRGFLGGRKTEEEERQP